mgnify:CR=1 FL=1
MTLRLKTTQILHGASSLSDVLDSKIGVAVDFLTTYDPASIAPSASISQVFSVTGATLNDFTHHSFSQNLVGLVMTSYVNQAGQVTVVLFNTTGSTINLAGGTLKLRLTRSA